MSRFRRLASAFGATVALLAVIGAGPAGARIQSAQLSVFPRYQYSGAQSPRGGVSADVQHLTLSTRASARPIVNPVFRSILPKLTGMTVPVLLPTYIPRQNAPGVHLSATVDDRGQFSYLVNLGFTPDCHGATACRFGEVTGGPEIDTPTIFDYPRGRHVRLRNGATALYYPYTCGASCGDSVLVFQVQGIVYTVGVKAGSLRDVLSMADSFAPAIGS